MYCENCGSEIGVNAEYCPECGTAVAKGRVTLKEVKEAMVLKENREEQKNQHQENQNQGSQGTQAIVNIPIAGYNPKWDYTPIGMWGYFFYNILFAIPLIGQIFLLIYALGGTKKINLRNYARSFFCMIIILAVIGLIVAAIISSL